MSTPMDLTSKPNTQANSYEEQIFHLDMDREYKPDNSPRLQMTETTATNTSKPPTTRDSMPLDNNNIEYNWEDAISDDSPNDNTHLFSVNKPSVNINSGTPPERNNNSKIPAASSATGKATVLTSNTNGNNGAAPSAKPKSKSKSKKKKEKKENNSIEDDKKMPFDSTFFASDNKLTESEIPIDKKNLLALINGTEKD
jgi:hypothetical protein